MKDRILDLYSQTKLKEQMTCECGATLIFTSRIAKGKCPHCGKEYDRNIIRDEVEKTWRLE